MRRHVRRVRPSLIELEPRLLRDGSVELPPLPGPPPTPPITDQQWLSFYGLNDVPVEVPGGGTVPATGQGQTVVIVSIYRDGSYRDSTDPDWLQSGLAVYSQEMGLTTDFNFTMVGEDGDADYADLPAPGTTQENREFDLDTQSIHTIAPQANIIDVVANSGSMADRIASFQTALLFHPAVISMSFSWTEAPFSNYLQWSFQGGLGTTIVESAGDSGAGMQYMSGTSEQPTDLQYQPIAAQSPETVMVGGSVLTPDGNSFSVSAWGDGDLSYVDHNGEDDPSDAAGDEGGGSGGGYSLYEPEPAYQALSPYVQQNVPLFPAAAQGMRLGPDLDMESKPGIELLTYMQTNDTYAYQWTQDIDGNADPIGGTSLAAPTFAAAMVLVAQARAVAQEPPLSSIDALNFLYQAPRSDFLDITEGNSGYPALPGFDLASGLGSPNPGLWQDLSDASYSTTATLSTLPTIAVAGQPLMLTATIAAPLATPTGSVTFLDDGRPIGTATLNDAGQAAFAFTPSGIGTLDLSVAYDSQGLFSGSTGAAPSTVVVAIPTSTTLAAARASSHRRFLLTLKATVSSAGPTPTGFVAFSADSRVLGTAEVDADGQATLTRRFLRHGRFRLSASYAAQGLFADSNSPVLRVNRCSGHFWTERGRRES